MKDVKRFSFEIQDGGSGYMAPGDEYVLSEDYDALIADYERLLKECHSLKWLNDKLLDIHFGFDKEPLNDNQI